MPDQAKALVQTEFPESFANLYVEMTQAFNGERSSPAKAELRTTRRPTRFEDFSHEFARAYAAA